MNFLNMPSLICKTVFSGCSYYALIREQLDINVKSCPYNIKKKYFELLSMESPGATVILIASTLFDFVVVLRNV